MLKENAASEQNDYANDVYGKVVFINDVESGQKGYWCIGCDTEMIAVHGKVENRRKHFRHVAKDVNIERKCTFSNEEYRHKLAIDILQFTKGIKVPNLYKYYLDGKSKRLIADSKYVQASAVKAELTFYEDNDGEVKWGKSKEIENKNLLIRPDITFFDSGGNPILLIEIVVTHKIDDEKKVKLKRLGIDTIQIIIPKDSKENIKKSLEKGGNTKWVYNNEQERIGFIQFSEGDTTELLSIDEIERRFSDESYKCRKIQLTNLIRSIDKCLGSERYRNIAEQLEQELPRVKTNTESASNGLEELRAGIRAGVDEKYRDAIESLEREESEFQQLYAESAGELRSKFDTARSGLEEHFGGLEIRYNSKISELAREAKICFADQRDTEREIEHYENVEATPQEFEDRERRIRDQIAAVPINEGDYRRGVEKRRREIRSRFKETEGDLLTKINSISEIFGREEATITKLEDGERESFRKEWKFIENQRNSLPDKFGGHKDRIKKSFRDQETAAERSYETEGNRIDSEFERFRERINNFMEGKSTIGNEGLSSGIKKLFDARRILNDWENEKCTFERYKFAIECLREGIYKKWD